MNTALLISLYIGIAFACYFIAVYFRMVEEHNDVDAMMLCAVWPATICMVGLTIAATIAIGIPFGIVWLSFEGVKILAEKARG